MGAREPMKGCQESTQLGEEDGDGGLIEVRQRFLQVGSL